MSGRYKPKTERYATDKQLIGAYVSKQEACRVALYCAQNGVSRTQVYKKLLSNFFKDIPTTDQLIEQITTSCLKEWEDLRLRNMNVIGWKTAENLEKKWEAFKREITQELKIKKIPVYVIEQILDYMEQKLSE